MDFIDQKTIYTVFHLIGVVLGAGGAYVSDAMFASTIKDEKVSTTEMRFLRIGSLFIWIGVGVLLISGLFLFLTDPAGYMASSKFLAKMTIVAIIIANGVVFHGTHLPRLERHMNHHFPSSDEFMRYRPLLIVNGAISFVSWTSALILGALRGIPYSYGDIMTVYGGLLLCAIFGALIILKHRPIRAI